MKPVYWFYISCLLPIEDGLIFFVRSIPLFIAIPLTANYDNLNQWRILAIILFGKWLFTRETWHYFGAWLVLLFRKPWIVIKEHPWAALFKILAILSLLSLWHAPDRIEGLKRIIYFINAALVAVVIVYPPRSHEFIKRLIKNIIAPIIIVVLVGVVQVASTYFIDIYQFMRIWGEGIQLREFGAMWSYIAVNVGNTWFAYFGDQPRSSVFPLSRLPFVSNIFTAWPARVFCLDSCQAARSSDKDARYAFYPVRSSLAEVRRTRAKGASEILRGLPVAS